MLTWPSSKRGATLTPAATMQRARSNACCSICAKRTQSLTGGQCMNLGCATSRSTPATRQRSPTGQRISAATLRQWLSIVRSFFLWLNRNGHLLHNPAERLALLRPEQSLPQVFNEAEIARLIETPDTTTTIGLRDRALLEVLYATGIRMLRCTTGSLRRTVALRDRVLLAGVVAYNQLVR